MFIMDHSGRKPLFVSSMLLTGVFTLICAFIEEGQLKTLLALIGTTRRRDYDALIDLLSLGKFGASASFSIIYMYTAELYPTEIRGTAMGLCSVLGRVGSIAAPQVINNQSSILERSRSQNVRTGLFVDCPVSGAGPQCRAPSPFPPGSMRHFRRPTLPRAARDLRHPGK